MAITDRLGCALLGGIWGALIGVACWWLYGLANSLNYDGPGFDPILQHWIKYVGDAFALLGFVFRERLGDLVDDTVAGIFHFEANDAPGSGARLIVGLVFLAIIIAAIWHTVPR